MATMPNGMTTGGGEVQEFADAEYAAGEYAMKCAEREVRVMQCIVTNILRRGNGKDDPVRIVRQVWSMDGELIAESDPLS